MEALAFLPPLVAALTTAIIGIVKEKSFRVFEARTKRIQFWKTMLDVAPLADVQDTTFIKQQCQAEMLEAVDAVVAESNKFVQEISWILTLSANTLFLIVMSLLEHDVLKMMRQSGAPEQAANQFAYLWALTQVIGYAVLWFWGRGRINRWIWNQIKPGALLEIVRENKRWQVVISLLACIPLIGVFWLITQTLKALTIGQH